MLDPLQKIDMMVGIAQGGAGQRGECLTILDKINWLLGESVGLPSAELKRRNEEKSAKFTSSVEMIDGYDLHMEFF